MEEETVWVIVVLCITALLLGFIGGHMYETRKFAENGYCSREGNGSSWIKCDILQGVIIK